MVLLSLLPIKETIAINSKTSNREPRLEARNNSSKIRIAKLLTRRL